MENFKGTKGFWRTKEHFDKKYNQPIIEIDCGEDTCSLATIWSGNVSGTEICDNTKADALLISKAPEMLEFLNQLSYACENGLIQDLDELSKSAKELIKSATEL